VLDYLHYHRAYKTPYELDRMRAAQRRAVPGHLAARAAFQAGASEAGIHAAYLAATGHTDLDAPYGSIVGLNEHGATLHYQYKDVDAPGRHRSLLIDAGAEVDGYASDITRTWGDGDPRFAALVAAVEAEQQALCGKVRAGTDYRDLHLECHLRLGGVLRTLGLVDMDPGDMLARGVTSTFFPHGLGHPIGLQVHDVAGFTDEAGQPIPRPEGHPFLRMTRTLEPGMVVTIEPGLYFIPTLLAKLRARPEGQAVDWDAVAALAPWGGVRIEDEVHCTDGEPENLTRDAFAAA
jgi:Xaa-Pro dipeptidase